MIKRDKNPHLIRDIIFSQKSIIQNLKGYKKDIKVPVINYSEHLFSSENERVEYFSHGRDDIVSILPENCKNILDVGCGAGGLGRNIKSQRNDIRITGLELDSRSAAIASQFYDQVIECDLNLDIPLVENDSFDCIILADVLEHLINPWLVLERLLSFLDEGGYVICSLPNIRNIFVINDLIEGSWSYRNAGILDRTHLRFFTKSTAEYMLQQKGLCLLKTLPILSSQAETDKVFIQSSIKEDIQGDNFTIYSLPVEEKKEFFVEQYIFLCKKTKNVFGLVSIIIVTFNKLNYTKNCLQSIYENTTAPFEIIIVDNGSTDDTINYIKSLRKDNIKLIENSENLGFSEGCNIGATAASGEYILFLNNDTIVCKNWLGLMLEKFLTDSNIGLIGPMTNVACNAQKLDPEYSDNFDHFSETATKLIINHAGQIIPSRRIIGFCMLMKKSVWDKCGPFDNRFGVGHFEDDDLSLRVERKGFKSIIAKDVFIYHFAGQGFDCLDIDELANLRRKAHIFYNKWGNKYKDWPNLLPNLVDAINIMVLFKDNVKEIPIPEDEAFSFLMNYILPGADDERKRSVLDLYGNNKIFNYYLSTSRRTEGESLGIGCFGSNFYGHIILESANIDIIDGIAFALTNLIEKTNNCSFLFYRNEDNNNPAAYYITREALESTGYPNPFKHNFKKIVEEHARRGVALGNKTIQVPLSQVPGKIEEQALPAAPWFLRKYQYLLALIKKRIIRKVLKKRKKRYWEQRFL